MYICHFEADGLQEPGSGIAATVGGRRVAVGTPDWLQRHGASLPASVDLSSGSSGAFDDAAALLDNQTGSRTQQSSNGPSKQVVATGGAQGSPPAAGLTRVYVAVDGRYAGCLDLKDAARPGAAATIAHLQVRALMIAYPAVTLFMAALALTGCRAQ